MTNIGPIAALSLLSIALVALVLLIDWFGRDRTAVDPRPRPDRVKQDWRSPE